jgi:hypothetical protein
MLLGGALSDRFSPRSTMLADGAAAPQPWRARGERRRRQRAKHKRRPGPRARIRLEGCPDQDRSAARAGGRGVHPSARQCRGKYKAILAVAHSVLVIAYCLLRTRCSYTDLGANYFERLEADRITRYHVGRLRHLGYDVTLTATQAA